MNMWIGIACILCELFIVADSRQLELREKWNTMAQNELNEAMKRAENYGVAKNLILFIGDGMGISTVTAARILKGQKAGKPGEETVLNFERFPHMALAKTYNTDHQVPDSAGTGTAYMTGVKTRKGVIAVDDSVTKGNCSTYRQEADLPSLLDMAEMEGKSSGVVTTTRITHASPACSYAKAADRDWEDDSNLPDDAKGKCKDIAQQLIERGKDIEVVLGGGRQQFMMNNQADPEYPAKRGNRKDGRDLIKEWIDDKDQRNLKNEYVWNKAEFDSVDPENVDTLLGLFEPSHMQYTTDRLAGKDGAGEPSLAEMTTKAIRILRKNKKGFFLFVEGGRIDHAHHDTTAKKALEDTLAFEDAVQSALDSTDSKDTLIVVTADHSHTMTIGSYPTRGHPILGISDDGMAADKKPYTTLLYTNGPGYSVVNGSRANITNVDTEDPSYEQQTAVPLESETHSGEDVAIHAQGPMAHLLHGTREQNYIAHVMAYAACIGDNKGHCSKPEVINIGPGLICVTTADSSTAESIKSSLLVLLISTLLQCFFRLEIMGSPL